MATEKRLIDADELVEKFRDHKDLFLNKMGGFQALLQREKGRVDELDNCIADVINAPTVDAVEVVRCKDCQYCDVYQAEAGTGSMLICMIHSFEVVDSNGFCSRGERRTDV